jgi:chorismate mutase
MNRITRRYQGESLAEREMLAYNASLHRANPSEHPFRERPYEAGTIYKLLGGAQSSRTKLKGKDRASLLTAISNNAMEIAKRDPKEFVQLQKDIELVSLDRLIAVFQVNLRRNGKEAAWQKLLELNPFILSMLFGQPVVILQSSASVGGQTLAGGGTKIADFLAKNPLSHNAAIVELKRPDTQLLGQEYRSNVFSPSQALMGSIVQILDQRHKLVTDVAGIKHRSKLLDLDVFAVECVVVAGRMPNEDGRLSSFELIRSQMKDVRIVTFDELLERLQLLRELLAGERYVSNIEDEEDQDWREDDLAPGRVLADADDDMGFGMTDEDRDPRD